MNKIQKFGLAPGTLVYEGEHPEVNIEVYVIDYDEHDVREFIVTHTDELLQYRHSPSITWINVIGLHDIKLIETIGSIFDIHPLVLEDILQTEQRPKADIYPDFIYVVMQMLNYNEKEDIFETEQMSIVFNDKYVISFQEVLGDDFNPIRERIRKGARIRQKKADYLAYALMDLVVDRYFYVLERMGTWLEEMEEEILARESDRDFIKEINDLRQDLVFLRKNIWPVREQINILSRQEAGIITPDTVIFMRDVYDHVIQLIDSVENYRELISSLRDLYLTELSFKMNEIMKTLTIIATIFIPITFITSLYGMNFSHMPGQDTPHGFWVITGIIVLITMGMFIYFRRQRWL